MHLSYPLDFPLGITEVAMAQRKNRKSRSTNPSSAAKKKPPQHPVVPRLLQVLDRAADERNPHLALELFETVLESSQALAAPSVFAGNAENLWQSAQAQFYLRSLHGVASSLWQLGRVQE